MERPLTIAECCDALGISYETFRAKRMEGGELHGLRPVSYNKRLFPAKVIQRLAEGDTLAEIYEPVNNSPSWSDFIMGAIGDGKGESALRP